MTAPADSARARSPWPTGSGNVTKKEKTTETALATAQRWKQEYETASPPTGGSAAVASVRPTTEQGRDAAVLTLTYSREGDGAPRRLSKTLVVVDSRQSVSPWASMYRRGSRPSPPRRTCWTEPAPSTGSATCSPAGAASQRGLRKVRR